MDTNNLSEQVRQTLQRYSKPYSAHFGVVPPPPTEESIPLQGVAVAISEAHAALKEAAIIAEHSPDARRLSRIPLRREALSSSAIEGIDSTLDELLMIEEVNWSSSVETLQVRDYAMTLEAVVPKAKDTGLAIFDLSMISDLHAATMRSDPAYGDQLGAYRNHVVWIGGTGGIGRSTYNPPPPEFVQRCMEDHIHYLHCDGMQRVNQDFITRLAVAHAHFEGVHPFRDGNGRVGRFLFPVMMAAEGHEPVYLSPFIEDNTQRYYDGLKAAQQRLDYSPLTVFMANAITKSVLESNRIRCDLSALREDWLKRVSFREGSAAKKTLDILHEYPFFTVGRLKSLLDVSYVTASDGIAKLVEVGILEEITGSGRNRVFSSPETFEILNRPFGDHEPAVSP